MNSREKTISRMQELSSESDKFELINNGSYYKVDAYIWSNWTLNVLNLFSYAFGETSDSYMFFKKVVNSQCRYEKELKEAKGILNAAKESYEKGFILPPLTEIEKKIPEIIEMLKNDKDLDDATKEYAISQTNILKSEMQKEKKSMPIIRGIISLLSDLSGIASLITSII